ncbi:hypothetical protein E8L99_14490 [Phreatobacter aquaticus]|uniref:Uncharacterized protein n=1 Tax=Phreatobacter aquaticus TaxID=2570229 RepID=A0A4D7QPK3_9HYPH|nr:hypothetical protein E8L99_14490 [Phreatobacter aquaticus]
MTETANHGGHEASATAERPVSSRAGDRAPSFLARFWPSRRSPDSLDGAWLEGRSPKVGSCDGASAQACVTEVARRGWSWRRRILVGSLAVVAACLIGPSAFLTWQIHSGSGLGLNMLTPWIARSLSEQMGDGRSVTIGSAVAVRDGSGKVEVEARDVVILDEDGRRVASMPRVALDLDGLPLFGRPAIRRIDMVGASVALKVGADGQIALAAGRFRQFLPEDGASSPQEPAQRPPDLTSQLPDPELSPFRRLGAWLDLIEKSGLDGHRLAGFGLRNGSVIVDDVRSGKRFIFAGIDFSVSVPDQGGVQVAVTASGSGARWTATAAVSARDGDGRRAIDLDMAGLSPRDLSLAIQSPQIFFADTPISGRLQARLDNSGDPSELAGQVIIGAGQVGDLNDGAMRLQIDHALARVNWQAGTPGLKVERIEVISGGNRAELSGLVKPPAAPGEPLVVDIAGAQATTSVLNPHEPPIPLNLGPVRFVYQPGTHVLTVDNLTVNQGGPPLATMNGRVTFQGASPAVSLAITAARMPLATTLALWPRVTNPEVRDWAADNMRGGMTEDLVIRVEVPEGLLANKPWRLEKEALTVQGRLRGTSLGLLPGLSPLRNADIDIKVDGQTAQLAILRGIIEPSPGKRLTITQGVFDIAEHRVADPRSVTRFKLEGSAEATFALLGQDAFKGAASGPTLPTGNIRGNVVANVTVAVPITEKFRPELADYRVEADFSGFAADNGFGEMRIDGAGFRVTTTPREFMLRGEGRLGGAQANFEYRKPRPDARPEIRLTATLDDGGRARLGLNLGTRISGPMPIKLMTIGEDSGRYTVEVDLGPSALNDLLPGWSKPRGTAAKARFTAVETDDGWKLEDLVVESRGVLVRGSAVLDDKGGLVSGMFPAYNLSDGDRMNVRVERAGTGHKVTVRGETMDARAMLRSVTEPPRAGGSASVGQAGDMDIDLKVAAVAGANGEVLRQFDLRMLRRGTEIRSLTASGRVGRNATLAVEQRGQGAAQRMVVSAGDAGAVLRFLDIYRTLQGGELALVMTPPQPDGSIREGGVEINNFAIRGDRAISGMVAAAGDPPERAVRQPSQPASAPNDAFAFSRLRANFARASGKVTVSDGLLWGVAIGATVEGEFDPGRDRLLLRGTYVPAYALNNIFARIPVLGLFLGGSPDEGVIGITYQISGQVSAPRLTVNPLSAVTPGFLRKMFEFRGRSSVPPGEVTGSASR